MPRAKQRRWRVAIETRQHLFVCQVHGLRAYTAIHRAFKRFKQAHPKAHLIDVYAHARIEET